MTIKKYFENNSFSNNSLTDLENKEGIDFESFEYLDELEKQRTRFIPNVDFSKPENFAFYGLAEQYYKDAIARVINNYPYDGSKKELTEWYNDSTYFDLYVFENEYPRSNGYGIFSADGWGTQTSTVDGYGLPATLEYIFIKGGPNAGPNNTYVGGNIYDPSKQRNSNLALNLDTKGATVEFWLKKDEFIPSSTAREVVFDLWNNELSSSDDYGRFRIELNTSSAGAGNFASSKAFRAIIHSGSNRQEVLLGDYTTTASFISQGWTHFAFATSKSTIKLYKNGELDSSATYGSDFGNVSGTLNAFVGALITNPSGSTATTGSGKLSGSVDEFRYWKTTRTERDIERNWFTNVYGGTNTDDANTDLGVYFKFNEGITGDTTIDATVLDYSGRISNGAWTGYTSNSRNIGSAIVSASAAEKEFKDPILRTTNALYTTYYNNSLEKGKRHDLNNSSNIYFSFPDWIIDEDLESGEKLLQLAQAAASYFDTAQLQVQSLRELKDIEYSSQTDVLDDKPNPFAERLLTERGMIAPDFFVERTVLEDLSQKTSGETLESDLFDLKNLIYQNIYNNLADLVKQKGTREAIRNILHTMGVGEELVSAKTYIDSEKLVLEDEKSYNNQSIRFIDFSKINFRDAVVYQTGSTSNELGYISSSSDKNALCVESFVRFPKIDENTNIDLIPNFLVSSLFGFHDIDDTSAPYNTWQSPAAASAFVRAVKNNYLAEQVYFELSSSVVGVTALTSSNFYNVYNNSDWYFSVQLQPQDILFPSSSAPDYDLIFSGYSYSGNNLNESFVVSSSVSRATALSFLQTNQKAYIGAERTNFTAGTVYSSDVRNAGLRFWLRNLTVDEQKDHAQDFLNYGSSTRLDNAYSLTSSVRQGDLAPTDYLALNWQFDKITTTDASGLIEVLDSTSGSSERRTRGTYVNEIAGYHHPATSYEFPTSSTDVVQTLFIDSYSPVEFDGYNSDNLIQIKTTENEKYGLNSRFVSFVSTVEKSAQAGINEEMLKMFGSVKELASNFAQPADRYKKEYKNLRFLRERFFKNVANDVDVEDFLHFYRWIDNAVQALVGQFIPAAANFNEDVFNVIESHVLERNKYQTKFPTLEHRQPGLIGSAQSLSSLSPIWRLGHAPIPEAQNTNSVWWKLRVERSNPVITSGDSNVDADREQIRLVKLSTVNRSYTTPQSFKVDDFYTEKDTRKATYWDSAIKEFGTIVGSETEDYLVSYANDVASLEDSNDVVEPNKKVRMDFKVQNNRESSESYSYGKGHLLAPYTMWSSSIDTGYQADLSSNFKTDIGINNQHDDTYSKFRNAPLQSPFTEGWVGGRQYRHIALNNGSDAFGTRPEGFYLTLTGSSNKQIRVTKTSYTNDGTADSDTPRASLFRDELAKRPINIANRQYSTASSRLGNFRNEYEVVMTNGRTKNNLWFHDNFASVLSQTEIWNLNLEPGVAAVTAEAASGQIVINNNSLNGETLTIPYTDVDSVTFTYKPSPTGPLDIQIGGGAGVTATNTRNKIASAAAAPLNTLLNVGGSSATITLEFKTAYVGADRNNTITSTAGGKLSLSGFSGGVDGVDYVPATPYANGTLPTREVVKSVIVNRFSAPGGPEIQSRGYLEPTGEEFSPYNAYPFRNTSVIYSSGSGNNDFTGALGPRVNTYTNIHTQNDGLRVLLSRRRGKYGVDSVFGSVRELDYNTTGSYQQVYDNPISQSTGINYDNFFVSHQIPRTPANYSWVANALNGSSGSFSYSRNATIPSGSTSQAVPFAELISSIERTTTDNRAFTGLFSGSSTPTSAVLTSSIYASMVDQGTTEITNELTASNVGINNFHIYTHAINNSIFGHNSFSQIRGGDTRQARSLRENNTLSFSYLGSRRKVDGGSIPIELVKNISMAPIVEHYPVKHQLLIGDKKPNFQYSFGNELEYLPLSDKQINAIAGTTEIRRKKKTNFNYISDSYVLGTSTQLRNIVYKQNIWPKAERTFIKESRQRTQFAINWWSSGRSTRSRNDVDNSLGNNVLTQSIWALDGVLNPTDQPQNLFTTFVSSSTDQYSNKYIFGAGELNNDCSLSYAVLAFASSGSLRFGGIPPSPFEQLTADQVLMESKVKSSTLYSRPFTINVQNLIYSYTGSGFPDVQAFVPHQIIGATPWTAAEEAGKEPFYYEDYDAYVQEARSAGKEYSVIPEFRISETIDQILTGEDGLSTILSPMLSITGGYLVDDTNNAFYTDYVNSDFLKYFNVIKNKHDSAGIENAGVLKLSCKAIKKFLPYEGFYPAQRVLQLGTLFSQSFSDVITTNGTGHPLRTNGVNAGGSFRTAMAPFFSPGVLCNSIKSGISVGYPIFTSSFDVLTQCTGTYLGNGSTAVYDGFSARISASFNYRMPFESVTDPLSFITTIIDSEPDESAVLYSTASYDSSRAGSPLYSYAVNNFLAETMNLFLANRSVSSLVSSGENDFGPFIPGNEYRMKVRVFEEGIDMYTGDRSFGPAVDDANNTNGTPVSYLPFLPPYDIGSTTQEEGVELVFKPTAEIHSIDYILSNLTESFTIYDDLGIAEGDSFGVDGRTKLTDSIQLKRKVEVGKSSRAVPSAPEYAISIQPKWETPVLDFSHRTSSMNVTNTSAQLTFEVDYSQLSSGDTVTLPDGNIGVTFTAKNANSFSDGEVRIGVSANEFLQNLHACITSSVGGIYSKATTLNNNFTCSVNSNAFTMSARVPGALENVVYSTSDANAFFNFNETIGSGFYDNSSVSDNYYVGMWHQYGRIPTGSQGIKMQITEPIITDTTGSLAQALGFTNTPVKIGEIADKRTVKEAIVAIPYTIVEGEKRLFPIDYAQFQSAKTFVRNGERNERPPVRDEYINLARKGQEYVLPPKYDFFYNTMRLSPSPSAAGLREGIAPFAMFIFEFNMTLNRQDLADIWQNLPPTSTSGKKDLTSGFDKEESTVDVAYGEEGSWFPEGLPANTRWMVFKVKQRAAYDYYEQVRNSSLAKGLGERVNAQGAFVNPTYSYNWPYDFFSFVELAKVDVEVANNTTEATTPSRFAAAASGRGATRRRGDSGAAEGGATSRTTPERAGVPRGTAPDSPTGG